jgi:hypothetical protein
MDEVIAVLFLKESGIDEHVWWDLGGDDDSGGVYVIRSLLDERCP